MWKWLLRRFGLVPQAAPFDGDYEPVYGLPRAQVEAWLALNPQLRKDYEVMAGRNAAASRGSAEVEGESGTVVQVLLPARGVPADPRPGNGVKGPLTAGVPQAGFTKKA